MIATNSAIGYGVSKGSETTVRLDIENLITHFLLPVTITQWANILPLRWPHPFGSNQEGFIQTAVWIITAFHLSFSGQIYICTSELPLIWTPEMRPPLYSGHFKMSQSKLPSANSPLK